MGGISQYILRLLPALARLDSGNEYHLFHSIREKRDLTPPHAGNFQAHTAYTPPHHRLEKWTLSAEIAPRRFDVWHSPDFIPPRFGAKRFIATIHDLNFIYYPQYLTPESRRYYLKQIGWAVQHADHISADSAQTKQDLIEKLGVSPAKITAIPLAANPIYQQEISPTAQRATLTKYQLQPGFLLFVGTLEPRKNIPTLLKAYALLRQRYQFEQPLLLAGRKGWLYEHIFEQISELKLSDFVCHLSQTTDIELAHLYASAAVLAMPSHYEGFGLPALEAMHCGCPIVVSDRGSLPEVAGDAGILLDPNDVEAWADNLAIAIEDKSRRQRMIAAGKKQAKKFDWATTAQKTLALYQNG